MSDNIIKFPKNTEKKPESFEQFEEKIIDSTKKEADKSAEFLWTCVLMDTHDNGFELDRFSKKQIAASIMVLESIRSLHYLTKGIDHPLQQVAEDMFTFEV